MRIALYQARTGIDPAANAEGLSDAIGEARAGGAAILFTPEMSGLIVVGGNGTLAAAREMWRNHKMPVVGVSDDALPVWKVPMVYDLPLPVCP